MGRNTAELPSGTVFTELEIAAPEGLTQDQRQARPENLGQVMLALTMLGGYLNYKRKR